MAPIAQPIPIPAFAPVLRLDEDGAWKGGGRLVVLDSLDEAAEAEEDELEGEVVAVVDNEVDDEVDNDVDDDLKVPGN
jgi:hypothetical protein